MRVETNIILVVGKQPGSGVFITRMTAQGEIVQGLPSVVACGM